MSERKIIGKSRRRRTCQERYDKISELEVEVRELKHKLRVSDEYGKDMLDEVVALRESGATLPTDKNED